jgi:iron(III) transport system substrate-binding protein
MWRRFAIATLAVGFGALLAGQAAAQEAPALAGASPAERARLAPIIAAAEKEGALTYWDVVIQPETNDELTAAFRKRYGLPASFQVNYNLASGPTFVTRLDQELAAGKVTVDVGAFSVLSWVYARLRGGDLLQYDSPEHAHYQQAMAAGIAEKGYFVPNGCYVFVPMWSEDHLKFHGTSYQDVLGAVPNGRIISGDAAKAAPQLAFYTGLRNALPADYFRKLAAMKPSFVIRSEQVASRLVSGEDLMAFGGMPTRAYQFNQKGAHLKFMLPKEGVVLLPQGTFILKKAPHPNAAKLWIDFILSNEGQTILVKHEALISARSGFKSPVPDYAPAIDSLKLVKMDWASLTKKDLEEKRAEWTSIFQP